jgi:hypothetical protein
MAESESVFQIERFTLELYALTLNLQPFAELRAWPFFFLFSMVWGRTAAVGSILICLPLEYAQSIQNFDMQFSASSEFLLSPPIKFMAQVGIFWDISRQDSSRMSISPPIIVGSGHR